MVRSEPNHDKNIYPLSAFFLWWSTTFIGALLGGWAASLAFGYVFIGDPLPTVLGYLILGSIPVACGQWFYLRSFAKRVAELDSYQSRVWFWLPACVLAIISFALPNFDVVGDLFLPDGLLDSEPRPATSWRWIFFVSGGLIQGCTLCWIFRFTRFTYYVFYGVTWTVMTQVGMVLGALPLFFILLGDPDPIVYWIAYGLGMGFGQAFVYGWLAANLRNTSGLFARVMKTKVATLVAITVAIFVLAMPVVIKLSNDLSKVRLSAQIELIKAKDDSLIEIIKGGDTKTIGLLISERDSHGIPILFYASQSKYYEIIDAMIAEGVDLSALNGERLIMESAAGDVEAVNCPGFVGGSIS